MIAKSLDIVNIFPANFHGEQALITWRDGGALLNSGALLPGPLLVRPTDMG